MIFYKDSTNGEILMDIFMISTTFGINKSTLKREITKHILDKNDYRKYKNIYLIEKDKTFDIIESILSKKLKLKIQRIKKIKYQNEYRKNK